MVFMGLVVHDKFWDNLINLCWLIESVIWEIFYYVTGFCN